MSSGRSWNHAIEALATMPTPTAGGTTIIATKNPAMILNATNCKKSLGRRRCARDFFREAIHSV